MSECLFRQQPFVGLPRRIGQAPENREDAGNIRVGAVGACFRHVAAIPVSAFYHGPGPSGFVRFCFCKRDEVLDEAVADCGGISVAWLREGGPQLAPSTDRSG